TLAEFDAEQLDATTRLTPHYETFTDDGSRNQLQPIAARRFARRERRAKGARRRARSALVRRAARLCQSKLSGSPRCAAQSAQPAVAARFAHRSEAEQ